jgi:thiamine biosynthesis lipoprotein
MKRFSWLLTILLLTAVGNPGAKAFPASATSAPAPHVYVSNYENVLGTSMELRISTGSASSSAKAENAVLHEIGRLSAILSAYDPHSEFSRWLNTRQTAVPVSRDLFEVLDLFDRWRIRTDGALDASAEVITKLWRQAAARGTAPSPEELSAAVSEVRQTHWRLDPVAQTATHLDNAPLMLSSFAKSYIIRHAADTGLTAGNLDAIVVNIGGDIVVAGRTNETIRISNPKADAENDAPLGQILVSNKAVATSGNYRRGELIGGHWYSHIVDPRTGQPADDILSATVIAPGATDAGALATAFNVMKVSESIHLAASLPGIEYLIVTRSGQRIESPGWKTLEIPAAAPINASFTTHATDPAVAAATTRTAAPPGPPAPGDFELLVNFEINLQSQQFVKRPYIAIWVEDENHVPVRTITVWHGSDRYLPELKSWYLKYHIIYANNKNFNTSITSATRSAGKYTVKWDGKDDDGNFVKPGKYVLKIEASREHGTYQLMRQEITWDETPRVVNLPGNVEIASASLDYRKKENGK